MLLLVYGLLCNQTTRFIKKNKPHLPIFFIYFANKLWIHIKHNMNLHIHMHVYYWTKNVYNDIIDPPVRITYIIKQLIEG